MSLGAAAPDHEVGRDDLLFDGVDGGIDRVQHRSELEIELIEPVERDIENRDMRLEAHRHARGIGSDHAPTEHDDFCGRNAGHAAEEHAAAALRDLKTMGACLNRHASGYFTHRLQQRQAAT